MKEYIERNGQTIQVSVSYNLGGMNHFTSTIERRGYYLSVSPVETVNVGNGLQTVSYKAFSGVKELLLEVPRKSKKAEQEAMELAKSRREVLIDHVLAKTN